MNNTPTLTGAAEEPVPATPWQLWRGRLVLLAVFSAFLGPLLLAVWLYAYLDVWRPARHINHGELLLPTRPLPLLAALDPRGQPLTLDDLRGRWVWVYVAQGPCDLYCQAQLFKMRQARALLGRDLVRVRTLYLALDEAAARATAWLRPDHPALRIGRVPAGQADAQRSAFGPDAPGHVYLLDPHGNLVLRYGRDSRTRGMLKDIHRLLKVSSIG